MKNDRNEGIDALRAVAVLLVVLNHAYPPGGLGTFLDPFLSLFERWGGHGLDLFFVLSGFCIHWAYSRESAGFEPKKYLARRWRRIWPPYFFALAFAVALNLAGAWQKHAAGLPVPTENFGVFQIGTHLFLVHNLFERTIHAVNGPFWTIALEAQFYLLYLAVRPLFFDRKGWMAVFAAAAVLHAAAWGVDHPGGFQPLNAFQYWLEWLFGAWAAFRVRKGEVRRGHAGLALVVGVSILAWALGPAAAWGDAWTVPLVGMGCYFILVATLAADPKIWTLPAAAVLPALGFFSYSIYLVHYPLLDRWKLMVTQAAPMGWLRFGVYAAGIAGAIAASKAFFELFERPFLTAKKAGESSGARAAAVLTERGGL